MLLAIAAASVAQTTAHTPPLDQATPVSKSEYMARVHELDAAIAANNTPQAEMLFGAVNQLVNDEMKVVRYKMRDATSTTERDRCVALTKTQRALFSKAMGYKQTGMTENRTQLIATLNEFGAIIE
ncbi:hypothetical protein GCM10023093_18020 [Nemorincola caseinilytica]|uniref:Uncharacterized protein n=2 Tax=Nemorincola caseinilytica TaxID=2054315 RepID=A0ABP8NHJ5_9BACT